MSQGENRSSGCKSAFLIGCGLLLVVLLAGVALVAFNWKNVTGAIDTARETVEQVLELRAELIERYPSAEIGVNQHFGSGGSRLRLELRDPEFLEEGADEEAAAREIAAFALSRWPDADSLDGIAVQFTRTGSGATRMSSRVSYEFSAEELREPGDPPADSEAAEPAPDGNGG